MMLQYKGRRAQDKKQAFSLHSKRAQEEMVGFAFIIIVVAVILVIFITFSLTKPSTEIESYEVESFIQAMLQYTSNCSDNLERLDIQKLISRCRTGGRCLDERDTCEVLNDELIGLLSESWKIENTPVKGYNLTITVEDKTMLSIAEGNQTSNFKGSTQKLPHEIDVSFDAYY